MICNIIPTVLDRLPRGEDGKCPIKVGFLTYGHTISFFNLSKELSQPQMMVSLKDKNLNFRWWKIKGKDAYFSISIMLFFIHLKQNSS